MDKCPDKNAKFTFELTGYMKQEITEDLVSQRSNVSTMDMPIANPSNIQPDFKKKRKEPAVIEGNQI